MSNELSYCIDLKPVSFLRQSEMVDECHVCGLAAAIGESGKWTAPIPVEMKTGIVMDGNHRLRAAAMLGLRYLPCVLLDYLDPRISVTHWKSGTPFCVAGIGKRILQDRGLFPYKTTRHCFAPTLPRVEIPLDLLSGDRDPTLSDRAGASGF